MYAGTLSKSFAQLLNGSGANRGLVERLVASYTDSAEAGPLALLDMLTQIEAVHPTATFFEGMLHLIPPLLRDATTIDGPQQFRAVDLLEKLVEQAEPAEVLAAGEKSWIFELVETIPAAIGTVLPLPPRSDANRCGTLPLCSRRHRPQNHRHPPPRLPRPCSHRGTSRRRRAVRSSCARACCCVFPFCAEGAGDHAQQLQLVAILVALTTSTTRRELYPDDEEIGDAFSKLEGMVTHEARMDAIEVLFCV